MNWGGFLCANTSSWVRRDEVIDYLVGRYYSVLGGSLCRLCEEDGHTQAGARGGSVMATAPWSPWWPVIS